MRKQELLERTARRVVEAGGSRFEKLLERFNGQWKANKRGCHIWIGHCNPYGAFSFHPGVIRAHRMSYIIHHGVVPRGLVVMHKCMKHACVNPEHLKAATHQENVSHDASFRIRVKCFRGHVYAGNSYQYGKLRICKSCLKLRKPSKYNAAGRHESYTRNRKLKMVSSPYATACKNGHPFTVENTYHAPPHGWRQCKICKKATLKRFHANGGKLELVPRKEHLAIRAAQTCA